MNDVQEMEDQCRRLRQEEIGKLEKNLRDSNEKITELNLKFEQLKFDFKYNLKLLSQRDAELDEYDKKIHKMQSELNEKDSRISDLCVKTEKLITDKEETLKSTVKKLRERESELQNRYQKEISELNTKFQAIDKDNSILRIQIEQYKLDIDGTKTDVISQYEDLIRVQTREAKSKELRLEELNKQLSLKCDILSNEVKETVQQNEEYVKKCEQSESSLRQLQWKMDDQLSAKEYQIRELENQLEKLTVEKYNATDSMGKRNAELERRLHELENCIVQLRSSNNIQQNETNNIVDQLNQSITERDNIILELKTFENKNIILEECKKELENEVSSLKKSNSNLQEIISKSKKEYQHIEAQKVQLELDFERKIEKLKREHGENIDFRLKEANKSHDLIRAQLIDCEQKLELALKQLENNHEIEDLSRQNVALRTTISQMREQMESVAVINKNNNDYDKDYATEFEENPPEIENAYIKAHVGDLNRQITKLRSEKIDLSSQVKSLQARLHTIESNSPENSKTSLTMQQLRYEIVANEEKFNSQINNYKKRLIDSEILLSESDARCKELHKIRLQIDDENSALRRQISDLKIRNAQTHKQFSFGAQELVIQQLENELANRPISENTTSDQTTFLKHKLKMAAAKIEQLIIEKQQLIDLSNGHKAQIEKLKNETSMTIKPSSPIPVKDLKQVDALSLDKLEQLEKLQYQLTKQQLVANKKQKTDDLLNTQSTLDQSLTNVWKLLDTSDLSETTPVKQDANKTNKLQIMAVPKKIQQQKSPIFAKRRQFTVPQKIKKVNIRNFNLKDDKTLTKTN